MVAVTVILIESSWKLVIVLEAVVVGDGVELDVVDRCSPINRRDMMSGFKTSVVAALEAAAVAVGAEVKSPAVGGRRDGMIKCGKFSLEVGPDPSEVLASEAAAESVVVAAEETLVISVVGPKSFGWPQPHCVLLVCCLLASADWSGFCSDSSSPV